MAVYAYKAVALDIEASADGAGSLIRGTIAADSPPAARELLRARGLRVKDLKQVRSTDKKQKRLGLIKRSYDNQVVAFGRELATLLSAGIPLMQSIEAIAQQHKGQFASSLLVLRDRVAAGISLAQAMREQSEIFDELSISMVDVGERSGTLDKVLEQMAGFKYRAQQFKGKIGTALIYPAIVITVGIAVMLFLMTFVVPNLLEALIESGKTLPFTTRVVQMISNALIDYWWVILLAVVAIVVSIVFAMRVPKVCWYWHRIQLSLPVIGDLIRKQALVRIAVTMATLTRSGVEFIAAIKIARRSTSNLILQDALQRCETAIGAGRDIAPALEATGAFPVTVVQIFAVGQASGQLDHMLERLAEDYDLQVQIATQRLISLFEPMLILMLAGFVGFIVLAIILPYLEVGHGL